MQYGLFHINSNLDGNLLLLFDVTFDGRTMENNRKLGNECEIRYVIRCD